MKGAWIKLREYLKIYLKSLYPTLKAKLFALLKSKFIKLVIKKVLGSGAMGGFKVWLVKLIATELYDEIGEPVLHFLFHEGEQGASKLKGKYIIKKMKKAREDGDAEAYDNASDDVYN